MCHFNRNAHNVAFCVFSCRALNIFYELLVIIVICNEKQNHLTSNNMSKRHGIFTENFIIFFSKAGKTGKVPEFQFDKF